MSRRSPRVKARFAATVQIAGVDHSLLCHTRDISTDGCFLDTSELVAPGVGLALAVMDNERGEVVSVEGRVTRVVSGEEKGIGVHLIDPPDEWQGLVQRYQQDREGAIPMGVRLTVLVVSPESHRRGALALYVTSGWDIRFAVDVPTAQEALGGVELDAVIAEFEANDDTWRHIMQSARDHQPKAKRLVRCKTKDTALPSSGNAELAHRFVDIDNGMDALLDALTASMS